MQQLAPPQTTDGTQAQMTSSVQKNYNQEGAKLCKDMLMTEKFVSGLRLIIGGSLKC